MATPDEHPTRGIRKPGANPGSVRQGRSWFFGIGINRYLHFPSLNNAVKDVEDLQAVLAEDYELDDDHVITLFDEQATRENIIIQFDRLVEEVKPEDRLLIYYSGHGHLNPRTEKGYWIPHDAEKDNTSDYVRNSTVLGYLEDIDSLHTLLISDSCFSGSLFVRGASRSADALEELEERRSRWALCSGRHDEEVYDGDPGQNSPFAASILETLRTNRYARLNVAKLIDRVISMTRANYRQLPEGNPLYGVGHKGGQYVFRLRASEENFWQQCRASHTLPAYNDYLERFPQGQYAEEALQHIRTLEEEQEWQRVRSLDRIYAYQQFLRSFSGGAHAAAARDRITALERGTPVDLPPPPKQERKSAAESGTANNRQDAVPAGGQPPAWRRYLPYAALALLGLAAALWLLSRDNEPAASEVPPAIEVEKERPAVTEESVLSSERQQAETPVAKPREEPVEREPAAPATDDREAKAWAMALRRDDAETYRRFIEAFPDSRHRAAAEQALAALQSRSEQEAAGQEKRAWEAARRENSIEAYRRYQQAYPGGLYFADAGKMIRELSAAAAAPERPYKEGKVTIGSFAYRVIQPAEGPAWMAENLREPTSGSACYDGQDANCARYGRLYSWQEADQLCRKLGWRLPTEKEWRSLAAQLGAANPSDDKQAFQALVNGGFDPAAGGLRSQSGMFSDLDRQGFYWTATKGKNGEMVYVNFFLRYKMMRSEDLPVTNGMSCRCVKN